MLYPTILKMPQVTAITSLSRPTIYRLMAAGTFVKPVYLTPRSIGFLDTEVHEWIAQRAALRSETPFTQHATA